MSRGKYSLSLKHWPEGYEFKYNCYGEIPEPWSIEQKNAGEIFDEQTMCDGHDEEGFDKYGYSAFDSEGNFVGLGIGIDRAGYTEMDYLQLKDIPEEHRDSYYYYNS